MTVHAAEQPTGVERPIIFGADSVRAILAGTKTQTRRKLDWRRFLRGPERNLLGAPSHIYWTGSRDGVVLYWGERDPGAAEIAARYPIDGHRPPHGMPSDRLWVRETWCQQVDIYGRLIDGAAYYGADGYDVISVDDATRSPWRSPIFMPRWASRLLLEIAEVRVQRLQEISEEDAQAEGIEELGPWGTDGCGAFGIPGGAGVAGGAITAFAAGWDRINGKRHGCSWSDNPWVWAYTFRRTESTA